MVSALPQKQQELIDAFRLNVGSGADAREALVDFLRRELLGPDPFSPAVQMSGEEILPLDNPPRRRYSCGVLFAQKSSNFAQEVGVENRDQSEGSEGDESAEGSSTEDGSENDYLEAPAETEMELSLSNEYLPSAMGISALVQLPKLLKVRITCATYYKATLGKSIKTSADLEAWFRQPHKIEIDLQYDQLISNSVIVLNKQLSDSDDRELSLKLHVVSRPFPTSNPAKDQRLITFSILNTNISERESIRDEQCFFQCQLTVDADEACFLNYPSKQPDPHDEDECSMHLLYGQKGVYAVGHGCAADWIENEQIQMASCIRTEVIPEFEVRPIVPREIGKIQLSMKQLWQGEKSEIIEVCRALAAEYEKWIAIEAKKHFASHIDEATSKRHMEECGKCLNRIRRGIDLIEEKEEVLRSFRLMNRAMLMQQEHYKLSSQHARSWILPDKARFPKLESEYNSPDYEKSDAKWRPFQLGFILMNIESMFSPSCKEREIVDIIWFPTGGGKTEAYLGLTSFTFFLRRLRNPSDSGTIAVMRYTLRLLTAQQFQRAAALICASELIRLENEKDLGRERFTIGLWVGSDVTPNSGCEAVACVNSLENGQKENKFVLMVCPWCGCQFGPVSFQRRTATVKGYFKESTNRVIFVCDDGACPFSKRGGLPVCVVDEDLYRAPPSLLIGTVDKFAMMPWKPESGIFFGFTKNGIKKAPPDLIIQDELHLISGPLGSMVGLYESMIEALTRLEAPRIKAKIIASTATIARSREQVRALYARESALFPPQATKAGESFFATEDLDAKGRLYVGVFNTALNSHVSSQVRVYAALLQGARLLYGAYEFVDPYWTLMSYYNSLRELGLAATLLDADVSEYIRFICGRYCIQKNYLDEPYRYQRSIRHHEELTGRLQSSELPEKLQLLFKKYTGDNSYPVDVCLATNMIQVGLDVSRLSLMQIVGQPKTTSEYIQASSRVGRSIKGPGLVIANLNPAKPRDRSHFEQFKQYHQNLYRFVEPTSVTPFAYPVRERALHAVVIALIRFWGAGALTDRPLPDLPQDLQARIVSDLLDRVSKTEPEELLDTEWMLNEFFQRWRFAAAAEYGGFGPAQPDPVPLMYQAGSDPDPSWHNRSFETPTAMRSVDANCEGVALQGLYPTRDSIKQEKEI